MLIQLLLSQYLKESFHSTAYSINVYVIPGQQAIRLVRYSREDIEGGKGPRIQIVFLKKASKKVSRKRPASPGNQSTLDGATQKRRWYVSLPYSKFCSTSVPNQVDGFRHRPECRRSCTRRQMGRPPCRARWDFCTIRISSSTSL